MKRCIVCGNIGSDDSVVCSECGNPFVEMDDTPEGDASEDSLEKMEEQLKEMWAKVQGEDEESPAAQETAGESRESPAVQETAGESGESPAVQETAGEPELTVATEGPTVQATGEAAAGAAKDVKNTQKPVTAPSDNISKTNSTGQQTVRQTARPGTRRGKGGPQIYGQDSMAEYSGAQGVIRRDVQGGHVSTEVQTGAGRSASRPPRRPASAPLGQDLTIQDAPTERPEKTQNAQSISENAAKPAVQPQKMSTPPYPQTAQGGQGHGQHGSKHSGTARRIMLAAQDALSSPLLIVIALLQTVYFVSSVAAIFLRQLNYEQAAKLLALLPLPSQISGYTSMLQAAMAQLDSGALALNLAIRIPDFLFCIALWALCITVRSDKEKMSGSGFLLMRIAVILNMILACAVLLVVLVVLVTFVIASWNTGTTSLITLAIAVLVLAIVATMAVLMYFFCFLATIKTVQKNAVSGERYGSVSVYVAVIKMVTALTALVSLLSGIVNFEITGITSGIGQLGWMILFGVWILKYKSTLREYVD